jgi:hypothetical protein
LTVRQVACQIYKQEIAAIAGKTANGAKPGEQAFMSAFQGSVTELLANLDGDQKLELEKTREEWTKEGYPIDVRRKTAEKKAHRSIQQVADSHYKDMGMRMVVWEFHENTAGMKLFQL